MLTTEECDRRRRFVTATDVAKLFGVSPWGNAADVFLEKTRGIVKPANAAMEAGNYLEPSVRAWANDQIGPLTEGDWFVAENGINAATLDSQRPDGCPVEVKTFGVTGFMPEEKRAEWGEEWSDHVPRHYALQLHAQLAVTGAPCGYLAALIGGRGFVMYRLPRIEAICDRILALSEQFWRENVEAGIAPPDAVPQLETLKLLRREPGIVADVPDEIVEAYHAAKEAEKTAKAATEEATAVLLHAMGDAEAGRWSGGEFTYFEQSRKAYTVEETTFRVLRQKAAKKAKVTA